MAYKYTVRVQVVMEYADGDQREYEYTVAFDDLDQATEYSSHVHLHETTPVDWMGNPMASDSGIVKTTTRAVGGGPTEVD